MKLIFKTAPDLEVVGTSEYDGLPVKVIDIFLGMYHVAFPDGRALHVYPDELFIKE